MASNMFSVLEGMEELAGGASVSDGLSAESSEGTKQGGAEEDTSFYESSKAEAATRNGKGSEPSTSKPTPHRSDPRREKLPTRTLKQKLYQPLVWLDLEMTGLDFEKDTIIEIAVIVSDGRLNKQVIGPDLAIHHPDSVLETMNPWSIEHHADSGLTERVRQSTLTMQDAEQQVLEFLQDYTQPKQALLAGNSVHVDLAFLRKDMPLLAEHLHYRIVDVSTVRELARRWFPTIYNNQPRKENKHTAMSDILESIEELKYFRKKIFIKDQ